MWTFLSPLNWFFSLTVTSEMLLSWKTIITTFCLSFRSHLAFASMSKVFPVPYWVMKINRLFELSWKILYCGKEKKKLTFFLVSSFPSFEWVFSLIQCELLASSGLFVFSKDWSVAVFDPSKVINFSALLFWIGKDFSIFSSVYSIRSPEKWSIEHLHSWK